MTGTLFDIIGASEDVEIEEAPKPSAPQKESGKSQGQLDFFGLAADREASPEQEEVGYWRSVVNSIPKGAMKGILQFGRMMGPLPEDSNAQDQSYNPEDISEALEQMFPTTEDFLPGAIERSLKTAPAILGSPGGLLAGGAKGTAARIATSGAAGEGAKQLDMPEWIQSVAEVVPLVAPSLSAMNKAGASEGAMAKLIAEKAPQKIAERVEGMMAKNASKKELLDFARQAGMTEKEITPLLQGEMKQKWLSKLASKGEAMQSKVQASKEGIGRVFNSLKESPSAQKVMSKSLSTRLTKGMQDKFQQMPSSVRNVMKDDLQQLLKGEMTGEKVIKFFRDVNHELGSKTKQLSTLKEPIKKALMELDPELGRSFDLTNKLYGKYAQISKRLKPGQYEELMSAGKGGAALLGLGTGDFGLLSGLAKYSGAKKIAEHMLTNPRMQSLGSKMVSALNQNKFVVAEHIKSQLIDEVKGVDPAVARALEELNIKDAFSKED